MPHIDNDKFDQLIAAGQYDEAKALLREFFEQEVDNADQGEYFVEIMTEYLEMSNKINAAYIEEMKELKSTLKNLNDAEGEIMKKIDIDKIRQDIENL